MPSADHHTALRSEVVDKVNAGHIDIVLAKLQSGKNDVAFTLHVNPTSFSTSGIQTADWLRALGFRENAQCQFTGARRCFSKEVDDPFDVREFATAFNGSYGHIQKAERHLQACGFWMPIAHRLSPAAQRYRQVLSGDGHAALSTKVLKTSEDDKFLFRFTFIDTGREKGFITHYRPRHPPLSSEVLSVFKYLGLKEFRDCPEFDFDPCYYRSLQLLQMDNPFDGNVDFAHKSFDAHASQFSTGIEELLAAQAAAERVGMAFLSIAKPADRLRTDIAQQIMRPTKVKSKPPAPTMAMDAALPANFDVAISFAGTEREFAEKLAERLRDAGISVFYDNFYPEQLWGKNLSAFLDEIYRKRSKYCVVFVSKEYNDRKWTIHELRSAQAKALEQKGDEYILPVKVDDTELDGLPPNIGYVDIKIGIDRIGDLLIKKLEV